MAKPFKDMDVFYKPPARPEPINLVLRHVIDWRVFEMWRRQDLEGITREVQNYMVSKLTAALMERLQPFIVESASSEGMCYQMEVMLSDRGTYERWLPVENEAGRREGYKQAVEALPYGMDPNEKWD